MDSSRPDFWKLPKGDTIKVGGKNVKFKRGKRYLMEIRYTSSMYMSQSFEPQVTCEPLLYVGDRVFKTESCTPGLIDIHKVISEIGD